MLRASVKDMRRRASGFILLAALVATWEGCSRSGLVDPVLLPPFTEVMARLVQVVLTGELPEHIVFTLVRCFGGYLLACLIAIPLGVAMGRVRFLHGLFEPLLEVLRPLPSAAIIPVAILFLGIYTQMKLFVVAFGCLWPILLNTLHGVQSIDPLLLDTGRTLNLSPTKFLTKIVLPAASPGIVTGMRISLAIALILTITVEMIAGDKGMGFFILDSERSFHYREMYAGILGLGILGYIVNYCFVRLDHRFMRWHRGFTASEA